jgi:hypothetical protein
MFAGLLADAKTGSKAHFSDRFLSTLARPAGFRQRDRAYPVNDSPHSTHCFTAAACAGRRFRLILSHAIHDLISLMPRRIVRCVHRAGRVRRRMSFTRPSRSYRVPARAG